MNKGKNIGLSEGDLVRLSDSFCIHKGEKNAYIGFEGTVKIDDKKEGRLSLFSGSAWLVNLSISDDRFEMIKKNTSGLFKIGNVEYYSKSSVIHKPKKCSNCGFIPVEYSIGGFWFNKVLCKNCEK